MLTTRQKAHLQSQVKALAWKVFRKASVAGMEDYRNRSSYYILLAEDEPTFSANPTREFHSAMSYLGPAWEYLNSINEVEVI